MIIIDHGDNYYTIYAHAEELFKSKSDTVETDEVIATVGDSGSYACDVDDGTKAIVTLGPVPVTVVAAGALPVAAVAGLALAAMACVAAGAMAIRRRK